MIKLINKIINLTVEERVNIIIIFSGGRGFNFFLGIGTFVHHLMSCFLQFLHPAGIKLFGHLFKVFRSVSLDLTGYVYSYGPLEACKYVC